MINLTRKIASLFSIRTKVTPGRPGVPAKTKKRSPWLDSWKDALADLKAFTPCLRTANLLGDSDFELLVATIDKRLVVYKNTRRVSTEPLVDYPVALCSYHTDTTLPMRPAVAVASGSHIFIYRNMTPYFKFKLPSVDVDPKEVKLWQLARQGQIAADLVCALFVSPVPWFTISTRSSLSLPPRRSGLPSSLHFSSLLALLTSLIPLNHNSSSSLTLQLGRVLLPLFVCRLSSLSPSLSTIIPAPNHSCKQPAV